jgi:LysR substrate binding domain
MPTFGKSVVMDELRIRFLPPASWSRIEFVREHAHSNWDCRQSPRNVLQTHFRPTSGRQFGSQYFEFSTSEATASPRLNTGGVQRVVVYLMAPATLTTVCRSQMWAASLFIRGCQTIRHEKASRDFGALIDFRGRTPLEASSRYLNVRSFVPVSGKKKEMLTFHPHLSMNDYTGLAVALLAGTGIGDLPPLVQPELVSQGKLIEVMPNWRFSTFHLWIVHIANHYMTRPVRAFKEFATQMAPKLFRKLPT